MRPIKSLSAEEIASYAKGEGMGFAKAAELNHYPGPRHVLDLADKLGLTGMQKRQGEKTFESMHRKAVQIGIKLVKAERGLDEEFSSRRIDPMQLDSLTASIGALQGLVRAAHLQAHLAEKEILTSEQVKIYDELRSYGKPEQHHDHMHH